VIGSYANLDLLSAAVCACNLIELVGSPAEGLKQTFSQPAEQTLLVNEYIYRYGDFEGFFTRSNVTLLTGATARQ
jgi:hypothetical protein